LDALLVTFPLAGAFTVMVKFVVAPLGKLARAGQVTMPPAYAPPPEALMKMSLLSNTSKTTTLLAAVGPRFGTVPVSTKLVNEVTLAGPDCVVAMSATGVT